MQAESADTGCKLTVGAPLMIPIIKGGCSNERPNYSMAGLSPLPIHLSGAHLLVEIVETQDGRSYIC